MKPPTPAAPEAGSFIQATLDLLTQRSAAATVGQLERLASGLGVTRRSAGEALARLRRDRLVESAVVVVRRVPCDGPTATFSPGDVGSDWGRFSARLRRRWRDAPQETTRVYRAGPRAARLFGPTAASPHKTHQLDHDLVLTDVFLRFRRRPCATRWLHESHLATAGVLAGRTKPDAVLLAGRQPLLAIEVGGQYRPARLKRIHQAMRRARLEWQLW